MGLYDNVFICDDILNIYEIRCSNCQTLSNNIFQTKDFGCGLETYFLDYDSDENIRLYKLDPPTDKVKYWREYTQEELNKFQEEYNNSNLKFMYSRRLEEKGEWKEEAWKPENRRKRHMGDLPHQICRFYTGCEYCDCEHKRGWIEIEIKFTDGIAVSLRKVKE